jgi:hypothetical protein
VEETAETRWARVLLCEEEERCEEEEVKAGRRTGRHAAARGFGEGGFDDNEDNAIVAAPWRLGAGERRRAVIDDAGALCNEAARIMAPRGLEWREKGGRDG